MTTSDPGDAEATMSRRGDHDSGGERRQLPTDDCLDAPVPFADAWGVPWP